MESDTLQRIYELAGRYSGLRLLVLFGSRARGDSHASSDWDFAFLADTDFDAEGLLGELVQATGSDRVDLVNLQSAGGLLRFQVARDGKALVDRDGAFERFKLEAIGFWADVEPVMREAYDDVLRRLDS